MGGSVTDQRDRPIRGKLSRWFQKFTVHALIAPLSFFTTHNRSHNAPVLPAVMKTIFSDASETFVTKKRGDFWERRPATFFLVRGEESQNSKWAECLGLKSQVDVAFHTHTHPAVGGGVRLSSCWRGCVIKFLPNICQSGRANAAEPDQIDRKQSQRGLGGTRRETMGFLQTSAILLHSIK